MASTFCRARAYCRKSNRHLLAYYRASVGQERSQAKQALQHRHPGSDPIRINVTIMEHHQ